MLLNLLQLITNQGNDALTGLIEDVPTFAPEFSQVPVVTKSGVTYKVLQRTGFPTAGFRQVNTGVVSGSSAYKQTIKEMYPFDCQVLVDQMIVQGDDESTGGDILTKEAIGALQQTLITLGSQFYYGTANDPLGFAGIRSQCVATLPVQTTTNTTSAYLVWLNEQGVTFPVGMKGNISMSPWVTAPIPVQQGSGTGIVLYYFSNISSFIGLTVGSNYSVFAITGLSPAATAGQYTLNDRLGAQLVSMVPLNRRQGLVWFMNRTAHSQLQQSRMTVYPGGSGTYGFSYQSVGANGLPGVSPMPDQLGGYPICVTDSIVNTETN